MASAHFSWSVSDCLIEAIEDTFEPSNQHGADLRFHGVVRATEGGRPISGIEYSAYETMAGPELEKIGNSICETNPHHFAQIHHRIGFVPAGEASLIIRVQTAHSAEGFELCAEYLRKIKETVPVWKKPVYLD
ncbi:MAG: molybdenum cofactor biosynthesis protein MoaE [Verrucomicrobiota bacterium]